MSTNDHALTAAEYATGLRALADLLEEHGLPASRKHPKQALTTTIFVESVAAVKDFAATYDLTVEVNENHTTARLVAGPNPNTYYAGSAVLSVVHIDRPDDETEAEPVDDPEPTGVDTYDCPEPGCDYNVSAVGTPDPDEPNEFAEDIEQHERGHAEAKERARLLAVAEECELGDNAEMARTCRSAAYAIPTPADPVGALTAPPGVVLVPPPGVTPEARQLLADQFAALAATGSVAHEPSSKTGPTALRFSHPAPTISEPVHLVPDQADAAVQLADAEAAPAGPDRTQVLAAEAALIAAALAWEASEHGAPWDHSDAEASLRATAHEYRKATNR